jgi:hypothetical protein
MAIAKKCEEFAKGKKIVVVLLKITIAPRNKTFSTETLFSFSNVSCYFNPALAAHKLD